MAFKPGHVPAHTGKTIAADPIRDSETVGRVKALLAGRTRDLALFTLAVNSMLRSGDLSMVKVWAGLEARKFLQASVETVENCVKYDQLSPNI